MDKRVEFPDGINVLVYGADTDEDAIKLALRFLHLRLVDTEKYAFGKVKVSEYHVRQVKAGDLHVEMEQKGKN